MVSLILSKNPQKRVSGRDPGMQPKLQRGTGVRDWLKKVIVWDRSSGKSRDVSETRIGKKIVGTDGKLSRHLPTDCLRKNSFDIELIHYLLQLG